MVQQGQIDHLLLETGQIPSPPHVSAQAALQDYDGIYARSIEDPEGFWAEAAEGLHCFRRWDEVFQWEYPNFRWFVGGQTNICYNALDVHLNTERRKQGGPHLAGRRRHGAGLYLRPPGPAGQPMRQRPQVPGHWQGRSGGNLHAPDAGRGHNHAGLRPHRRHPQRSLCRFQRGFSAGPYPGCLGQAADHRRRGLPPGQQG